MSGYQTRVVAAMGAGLLAASVALAAPASAAAGGGNLSCPAKTKMLKIDRAPVEGETITDGKLTVKITDTLAKIDGSKEVYGFYADFSGATLKQVIVKGGPTAIRYFNPDALFATRKAGTPSGKHYEISNVKFCYTANKTA